MSSFWFKRQFRFPYMVYTLPYLIELIQANWVNFNCCSPLQMWQLPSHGKQGSCHHTARVAAAITQLCQVCWTLYSCIGHWVSRYLCESTSSEKINWLSELLSHMLSPSLCIFSCEPLISSLTRPLPTFSTRNYCHHTGIHILKWTNVYHIIQ